MPPISRSLCIHIRRCQRRSAFPPRRLRAPSPTYTCPRKGSSSFFCATGRQQQPPRRVACCCRPVSEAGVSPNGNRPLATFYTEKPVTRHGGGRDRTWPVAHGERKRWDHPVRVQSRSRRTCDSTFPMLFATGFRRNAACAAQTSSIFG